MKSLANNISELDKKIESIFVSRVIYRMYYEPQMKSKYFQDFGHPSLNIDPNWTELAKILFGGIAGNFAYDIIKNMVFKVLDKNEYPGLSLYAKYRFSKDILKGKTLDPRLEKILNMEARFMSSTKMLSVSEKRMLVKHFKSLIRNLNIKVK